MSVVIVITPEISAISSEPFAKLINCDSVETVIALNEFIKKPMVTKKIVKTLLISIFMRNAKG